MNTWKKMMLWLGLLTKRLYKKPTFLVILLLIPVLVLCYSILSRGESGILTIALYGTDDVSQEIFQELESRGPLIRYVYCTDAEEAKTLVSTGKADSAWIFPADMTGSIKAFVDNSDDDQAFIDIYQRDNHVSLIMVKEHLCAALYPRIARAFYLDYVREEFPAMAHLRDGELLTYYDSVAMPQELFVYDTEEALKLQKLDHLLSPVRGMLAIVIVMGGLAAAMYFLRDQEQGTFLWVPEKRRGLVELGCQVVALLNVSLVALLTMVLVGMAEGIPVELLTAVLYSLCVAAFSMLLRRVLGSIHAIGTVMPLLIVVMLLVCPVFFDLGMFHRLQLLFPPTYYINAVYNSRYLAYMPIYAMSCGILYLILGKQNHLAIIHP